MDVGSLEQNDTYLTYIKELEVELIRTCRCFEK